MRGMESEDFPRDGGIADHWERVRKSIDERYPPAPSQPQHPAPVPRYRTAVSESEALAQFHDFLRDEMHLDVRGALNADGRWHNVPVQGDRRLERSGGYQLHLDGVVTGGARNWKEGLAKDGWHPTGERVSVSREEGEELARLATLRRMQNNLDRLAENAAAVVKARTLIALSDPASADHPYLARKQLDGEGFRQMNLPAQMNGRDINGYLLIPRYIPNGADGGKLSGLQAISPEGDKQWLAGAPVKRSYAVWGDPSREGPIMIAAGAATAASIYAATRQATYMAGDDNNLLAVAQHVRARFPDRQIMVAADNDQWHFKPGAWEALGRPNRAEFPGDDVKWAGWREVGMLDNPGSSKAVAAAVAIRATTVIPNIPSNHPRKHTDFSDILVERGAEAVRAQFNHPLEQKPGRRNGIRMGM